MQIQLVVFFLLFLKVVALVAGISYFKKLSVPYRIVLYLLALAIFCESFGYYLTSIKHINLWLFNFYALVEVWMLGIAGLYFLPNKRSRTITIVSLIAVSAIWLTNILTTSIFVYANYAGASCSLLLTILYVAILIRNCIFNQEHLLTQPMFWLAASNILFFSCIIPFMSLYNYFYKLPHSIGMTLSYIIFILNFIRYPLVGISFILRGRESARALKAY